MTLTQIKPLGLSKPVDLADNEKIRLGTGNDLQLFHDGSNSYLHESGTGSLVIASNGSGIWFQKDVSSSENLAIFRTDGACELNYNNSKKFETTNTGAVVTGALSATGSISSGGNVSLVDTGAVILGTGNDCTMSHSGTNTIIDNNTGDLILRCDGDDVKILAEDGIVLRDNDDSTNFVNCINGGAVELYHNGSKKLETISTGVSVTGDVESTTGIFERTNNGTSQLEFAGTATTRLKHLSNAQVDLEFWGYNNVFGGAVDAQTNQGYIRLKNGADEQAVMCRANGAVELYYDNSKKLETTSAGTLTSGTVVTDMDGGTAGKGQLAFGQSGRPFIEGFDSGNHGSGATLNFRTGAGDYMAKMKFDNAVELYYDNSKKFETHNNGTKVSGVLSVGHDPQSTHNSTYVVQGKASSQCLFIAFRSEDGTNLSSNGMLMGLDGNYHYLIGRENRPLQFGAGSGSTTLELQTNGTLRPTANNSYDLGTSSRRWRNIYTNDLNLSNEGSSNDVDGSWGNWTIQEGESDLFLKNNRSGKKYKFNLTEVS